MGRSVTVVYSMASGGLEWAVLWSTIPWFLVGLAPVRASFDGVDTAVFLKVASQGSLLAFHCFALAYRRDCFFQVQCRIYL